MERATAGLAGLLLANRAELETNPLNLPIGSPASSPRMVYLFLWKTASVHQSACNLRLE
jgi:hypothetical protein